MVFRKSEVSFNVIIVLRKFFSINDRDWGNLDRCREWVFWLGVIFRVDGEDECKFMLLLSVLFVWVIVVVVVVRVFIGC